MTPDPELLKGCLKNDRRSQQQLYELSYRLMMGVCLRYAGDRDEARAWVNQAFLKILLSLQQYRLDSPFEAWARTIVVRTAIDEFRKNRSYRQLLQQTEELPEVSDTGRLPVNDAVQKLEASYIIGCLNQLPPVSRQVFNLFALDGYTHREIASMLGISEGTTKWHVNHARQKLKLMITELIRQETLAYEK